MVIVDGVEAPNVILINQPEQNIKIINTVDDKIFITRTDKTNHVEVDMVEIRPIVKPVVVPVAETETVVEVVPVPDRKLPTNLEVSEKITPIFD